LTEKLTIGHQAMKHQQRAAGAVLVIGDTSAVRSNECLQSILPPPLVPVRNLRQDDPCPKLKGESIFRLGESSALEAN
jgi:hypothetical protein